MNSNFERAFEETKKGNYLNAKKLYHDLLLDIHTYSDYFLLKELLFLLDLKIAGEQHASYDMEADIQSMNYVLYTKEEDLLKFTTKKDTFPYQKVILIQKGFLKTSFIGFNEELGLMNIRFYIGKTNFVINEVDMQAFYLLEYRNGLYAYHRGCEFVQLDNHKITPEFNSLMLLINTILFDYHLSHPSLLINLDKIHTWFNTINAKMDVDLSRIELIDLSSFSFDQKTEKAIEHCFKLMAPLMWLSDNNELKVPVQDMQYDLLGNKWGSHRDFLEWLCVLKVLPFIEFGKSVFFHHDSYYLPYEQSYYIVRSITRLENDVEIDLK